MNTKAQVLKWLEDNHLTDMTMQVFPPDGWTWIKNATTKTYDLLNPETHETIIRGDFDEPVIN